ncbi:ribonuclease H1 [Mycena alexandri]|uniref:ribonuclease H n=1 Tax=Mycena alexandri TaxID=1745969 RepID=A0AAD6T508_9AGAR|nr:ribonuclease H1 [Mycena alexandri]
MTFNLDVWTDGACRRNGHDGAVGGAGVWFPRFPPGCRSEPLPPSPKPTNQRAELTAIILALEEALRKQNITCATNPRPPFFVLNVNTDSQYAVSCLTEWIFNWMHNGWLTTNYQPVQNADLIQEADSLRVTLEESFGGGKVNFTWVPRAQNTDADRLANEGCDEAERFAAALQADWHNYF